MTPARLSNCDSPQEKRFVRRIAKMGDNDLIALTIKLAGEKPSNKRPWWVVEREHCFASLELMDRGYVEENTWVKA